MKLCYNVIEREMILIRHFIICIPLFFFSTYLEVIKVFYFQNNNGLIASSDYKDIAYLVWKTSTATMENSVEIS